MNNSLEKAKKRAQLLEQVTVDWLGRQVDTYPEPLNEAFHKTVEEGLFPANDIRHHLEEIRRQVSAKNLFNWFKAQFEEYGEKGKSMEKKTVLCLHAGNFPLAGFQNALAVLLSGARYTGKLSSKDPHLLASWLEIAQNYQLPVEHFTTELPQIPQKQYSAVLFAGDQDSVAPLQNKLRHHKLVSDQTRYLMRTAHYSLAYLYDLKEETISALVEGMLRYEGRGCRSVAMVLSPRRLDAHKDEIKAAVSAFLDENPPAKPEKELVSYRRAYYRAIGKTAIHVSPYLISPGTGMPEIPQIIHWQQSDEHKVLELLRNYGGQIQSIYSDRPEQLTRHLPALNYPVEPPVQAQKPPIHWKPDQVDTIGWLLKQLNR